jgi:hypothetical protein
MSKILYAFGWFAVGMIASAFPFSLLTCLGLFWLHDFWGSMVWPCAGIVYGISLWYHQRWDNEETEHGQ